MSHLPAQGVAGAEFPAAGAAGGDFAGGFGGAEFPAATGAEILPFTGSIFTLPIALLGLFLTFAGWVLTRLGGEDA